jgi:hypothetical protein
LRTCSAAITAGWLKYSEAVIESMHASGPPAAPPSGGVERERERMCAASVWCRRRDKNRTSNQ